MNENTPAMKENLENKVLSLGKRALLGVAAGAYLLSQAGCAAQVIPTVPRPAIHRTSSQALGGAVGLADPAPNPEVIIPKDEPESIVTPRPLPTPEEIDVVIKPMLQFFYNGSKDNNPDYGTAAGTSRFITRLDGVETAMIDSNIDGKLDSLRLEAYDGRNMDVYNDSGKNVKRDGDAYIIEGESISEIQKPYKSSISGYLQSIVDEAEELDTQGLLQVEVFGIDEKANVRTILLSGPNFYLIASDGDGDGVVDAIKYSIFEEGLRGSDQASVVIVENKDADIQSIIGPLIKKYSLENSVDTQDTLDPEYTV